MKKLFVCLALSCTALLAAAGTANAQQKVPFRNNIPVAPSGIPAVPLPDAPVVYDTAEGQKIRVSAVVRGLANPWSLVWLPDGTMLVTERPGRLRVVRKGVLDPKPVEGVPAIFSAGLNGLMEVALHPAVRVQRPRLPDLRQASQPPVRRRRPRWRWLAGAGTAPRWSRRRTSSPPAPA